MTDNDFKKLLDQALEPIKKDLQEVKETQEERVLPSVIHTETVLEGYADSYKTNKKNIERLDERLSKFEGDAGVILPPELAIQR